MSDRRYEVYGVRKCDCGCADWPNQHAESYALLDSIPDALVDEAAKAIDIVFAGDGSSARLWRDEARAALSVLFPGDEE